MSQLHLVLFSLQLHLDVSSVSFKLQSFILRLNQHSRRSAPVQRREEVLDQPVNECFMKKRKQRGNRSRCGLKKLLLEKLISCVLDVVVTWSLFTITAQGGSTQPLISGLVTSSCSVKLNFTLFQWSINSPWIQKAATELPGGGGGGDRHMHGRRDKTNWKAKQKLLAVWFKWKRINPC